MSEQRTLVTTGENRVYDPRWDRLDRVDCMLACLFASQYEFGKRVGFDPATLDTPEKRMEWVMKHTQAAGQELAELLNCCAWKHWKSMQFDQDAARDELVDVVLFAIAIAQALGMSANDLVTMCNRKIDLNNQRQDAGYGRHSGD